MAWILSQRWNHKYLNDPKLQFSLRVEGKKRLQSATLQECCFSSLFFINPELSGFSQTIATVGTLHPFIV